MHAKPIERNGYKFHHTHIQNIILGETIHRKNFIPTIYYQIKGN